MKTDQKGIISSLLWSHCIDAGLQRCDLFTNEGQNTEVTIIYLGRDFSLFSFVKLHLLLYVYHWNTFTSIFQFKNCRSIITNTLVGFPLKLVGLLMIYFRLKLQCLDPGRFFPVGEKCDNPCLLQNLSLRPILPIFRIS